MVIVNSKVFLISVSVVLKVAHQSLVYGDRGGRGCTLRRPTLLRLATTGPSMLQRGVFHISRHILLNKAKRKVGGKLHVHVGVSPVWLAMQYNDETGNQRCATVDAVPLVHDPEMVRHCFLAYPEIRCHLLIRFACRQKGKNLQLPSRQGAPVELCSYRSDLRVHGR